MRAWLSIESALRESRERFEQTLCHPVEHQLDQLHRILHTQADTAFGHRHGFRDIDGVEAFRRRVPVLDYETLREDIEAMGGGAQDRLCRECLFFEETGGSTAGPKLIPQTAAGLAALQLALRPWLADLLDDLDVPEGVEVRREFAAIDALPRFDGDRLRRAVINIYENACHAMADREASNGEKVLSIATRVAGSRLEISISDTGDGMPSDVLESAFEPLYSTKASGVGLGLTLVKQIMEQHGGGVEFESAPGKGTNTVLWLPLPEPAWQAAS